jgi:hypothetical protein
MAPSRSSIRRTSTRARPLLGGGDALRGAGRERRPTRGANLVERHRRAWSTTTWISPRSGPDLEPRMIEAVTAGLRGKPEDRVPNARALQALWVGTRRSRSRRTRCCGAGDRHPPPERTLVPPRSSPRRCPNGRRARLPPAEPDGARPSKPVQRQSWAPWLGLGVATLGLLLVWWRMLAPPDPAPRRRSPSRVVAEATRPRRNPPWSPSSAARGETGADAREARGEAKAPVVEAPPRPPPETKAAAGAQRHDRRRGTELSARYVGEDVAPSRVRSRGSVPALRLLGSRQGHGDQERDGRRCPDDPLRAEPADVPADGRFRILAPCSHSACSPPRWPRPPRVPAPLAPAALEASLREAESAWSALTCSASTA